MNDADKKDLDLLLEDVRRAVAVFGAKTIRSALLTFTDNADVPITLTAPSGGASLTAVELAYAKKHGLDVAEMAKSKALALSNGTYPG